MQNLIFFLFSFDFYSYTYIIQVLIFILPSDIFITKVITFRHFSIFNFYLSYLFQMAQLISVRLNRGDACPWGFRLQGGKDFGTPLVIQKVI